MDLSERLAFLLAYPPTLVLYPNPQLQQVSLLAHKLLMPGKARKSVCRSVLSLFHQTQFPSFIPSSSAEQPWQHSLPTYSQLLGISQIFTYLPSPPTCSFFQTPKTKHHSFQGNKADPHLFYCYWDSTHPCPSVISSSVAGNLLWSPFPLTLSPLQLSFLQLIPYPSLQH